MKIEEKEFVSRCEMQLPDEILINEVKYKLIAHGTMDNGFTVSYVEIKVINGVLEDKEILRFIYFIEDANISKETQERLKPTNGSVIYKKNLDDIISDCQERINDYLRTYYKEKDRIGFGKELASLLEKHNKGKEFDTPEIILSSYLVECLNSFNRVVGLREQFFGRKTVSVEENKTISND